MYVWHSDILFFTLPTVCRADLLSWGEHADMATLPRFHAPLHNYTPIWGPSTSMNRAAATNAFLVTLLIKVIEILFNFQIYVQYSQKAISKITFNVKEILSKYDICGTPDYQRVTSRVSRTMGPEWPDKRDKTGFDSVTRGGGGGGGFVWSSSLA